MTISPREKALQFAENGRLIAHAIMGAIWNARPDDYRLLATYAYRLRKCNDDSNIWLASDLHNHDYELFDGSGRFWQCNSKLCPFCIANSSRKTRKIIRSSLDANPSPPNPSPKFVTLTIENPNLPVLQTRSIINHAWSMFRKRNYFKVNIKGGTKNEEFTVTKNGYHWHIHCLMQSNYINYQDFRYQWTSCVSSAFEAQGLKLEPKTKDRMLIVKILAITSRESAISEVSKYITKSDSWRKLPTSDLLSVCRIQRWPRMFETFGTFKNTLDGAVEDEEMLPHPSIVHTKSLSDGKRNPWRDALRNESDAEFASSLCDIISRSCEWRSDQLKVKYPYATFTRLRFKPNPDVDSLHLNQMRKLNARARIDITPAITTFNQLESYHLDRDRD